MTTGKEAGVDDAKHERDDDPFVFTPPPGPTPREVRRRYAERGDVESLLAVIRTKSWGFFSVDEVGDPLLGLAPIGLHQPPVMGQVGEPASRRQLLLPRREHRLRQGPDRVPWSGGPLCVAVKRGRAGHHREAMISAIRRHRP